MNLNILHGWFAIEESQKHKTNLGILDILPVCIWAQVDPVYVKMQQNDEHKPHTTQ